MEVPTLQPGDLVLWNAQQYVGDSHKYLWVPQGILILDGGEVGLYAVLWLTDYKKNQLVSHSTLSRWACQTDVNLRCFRDGEVIFQGL